MLLQRLVEFQPADDPDQADAARPYSRIRTARWELDLDHDGSAVLIDLADPSEAATKNGLPKLVPNAGRTSAIAPSPGGDDIQYVLGWVDEERKPERVEAAHVAFIDLVRRWAREAPAEAGHAALLAFYDHGGPATLTKPAKWSSKDLVVIKVAGRYLTDADSLWSLWKTVVEERKSSSASAEGGRQGLCLVCGQVGTLLSRMPQALPKALVPGADQEVTLVSANRAIHTYDFREGLGTAPICLDCGQSAVANLHTVLSDRAHTFFYSRQRTRLGWWVTNGGDTQSIAMLDENPDVIADYLHSATTGRRPRVLPKHTFCAVTVSGNASRLVVHDWIDMPLVLVEGNIQRWFDDHTVVHRWEGRNAYYPLWRLVSCAGQWLPNTASVSGAAQGRYIELTNKTADRPDDLAPLLLHAALHAAPLPPHVLAHVVRRVRTDLRIDEPRAALVRVALTRLAHRTTEAPMSGLDEERTDPPYLSGRIFAVLESLQRRAYRGENLPNTSFYDRYYAGAIGNPRVALIQGEQLAPAWIKKLEGAGRRGGPNAGRDTGAARALKDRLTELNDKLHGAPPATANTEAQSLFILGYYQQRAHDIAHARAGRAPEIVLDDTATEPANYTTPSE